MALSRPVATDFWISSKVSNEYTLDDKLVYVYLATNEHTQQLGVFKISKRMVAAELNMELDRVEKAFDRLENLFDVIKYSPETNEIAILDYYSYGILKGGIVFNKCFENIGKKVENFELLKAVYKRSLNISDEREAFKTAMRKVKEMLNSLHMLDD